MKTDNPQLMDRPERFTKLLRNQQFGNVGTLSALLIPGNMRRVGLIIGSPLPAALTSPNDQTIAAVSVASLGTKLSYTAPAGRTATLTAATFAMDSGANPTINLRYTPSGGAATILGGFAGVAQGQLVLNYPLNAGDIVDWNVAVAGAAGVADLTLGILQSNLLTRVSIDTERAAVLDQGITIYSGLLPWQVYDEFAGLAFKEDVFAISSVANTLVPWIEILRP